jgi:hypothetical protein
METQARMNLSALAWFASMVLCRKLEAGETMR